MKEIQTDTSVWFILSSEEYAEFEKALELPLDDNRKLKDLFNQESPSDS